MGYHEVPVNGLWCSAAHRVIDLVVSSTYEAIDAARALLWVYEGLTLGLSRERGGGGLVEDDVHEVVGVGLTNIEEEEEERDDGWRYRQEAQPPLGLQVLPIFGVVVLGWGKS